MSDQTLRDAIAEAIEGVAERHGLMEATGGYIECTCGWPTREQWEAGEHAAVHIATDALAKAGVLASLLASHCPKNVDAHSCTPVRFSPVKQGT